MSDENFDLLRSKYSMAFYHLMTAKDLLERAENDLNCAYKLSREFCNRAGMKDAIDRDKLPIHCNRIRKILTFIDKQING